MMNPFARRLVTGIAVAALGCAVAPAGEAARPARAQALSAADAVRAAVVSRLGVEATVELESLDISSHARVFREARPDPAARLGRPVRFRLVTEGGAALPATATMTVTGALVVTTRTVARGESLKAEDLNDSRRVITDMPLRRLPRLNELVGSRALRVLPAGEAVPGNAVALRRKVEPGDLVTVVAASGAIEITATFVAADGGQPGHVIRVRNPETRRFLRGRVLDDGTIEVIDGR
jgi:flagella basal body P-ring formation protein FlgA